MNILKDVTASKPYEHRRTHSTEAFIHSIKNFSHIRPLCFSMSLFLPSFFFKTSHMSHRKRCLRLSFTFKRWKIERGFWFSFFFFIVRECAFQFSRTKLQKKNVLNVKGKAHVSVDEKFDLKFNEFLIQQGNLKRKLF